MRADKRRAKYFSECGLWLSLVERLVRDYFWRVSIGFAHLHTLPSSIARYPFCIGKIASSVALNHVISRHPQERTAVSHGSDNSFSGERERIRGMAALKRRL